MPKILITGNGFDLNIELPTAYSDFMNILKLVEVENKTDFETAFSVSKEYKQIIDSFESIVYDYSKIDYLKSLIKSNKWFQFFNTEYEIETWIDFENKIEHVLSTLFLSLECFDTNIFSKGSLPKSDKTYLPKTLSNNVEMIEVLCAFNIITKVDQKYNFKVNEEFFVTKYECYLRINTDEISNRLQFELNNFKEIFKLYFQIFVMPLIDISKNKNNLKQLEKIQNHYTFNYTPTFELLYGSKNITKYLHGSILAESNNIVLGISEVPDIKGVNKRDFLPFTKYFQRMNNKTDFNFLKNHENNLRENYQFFFLGHSLDKSDADYINEVFDFFKMLKSSIKKIVIIYHDEKSRSNLLLNLFIIRGKKEIENLMKEKGLELLLIDSDEVNLELNKDITRNIYT